MVWGRGGAGNLTQAEEAKKRDAEDLEANRTNANTSFSSELDDLVTSTGAGQEYAHSGRGGAGNWFSPQMLNATGSFTTSETKPKDSTVSTDTPVQTKYSGRGGAGNFNYRDVEEERARQQALEKAAKLRENIAKDVEAGLTKPTRALVKEPDI